MNQPLATLLITVPALWALLAWPARWLWGEKAFDQSLAAMLVCLLAGVVTEQLVHRLPMGTPDARFLRRLLGSVVRPALVLGGGWLLFTQVASLSEPSFWLWLCVFYFTTLALEIRRLLAEPADPRQTAVSSVVPGDPTEK